MVHGTRPVDPLFLGNARAYLVGRAVHDFLLKSFPKAAHILRNHLLFFYLILLAIAEYSVYSENGLGPKKTRLLPSVIVQWFEINRLYDITNWPMLLIVCVFQGVATVTNSFVRRIPNHASLYLPTKDVLICASGTYTIKGSPFSKGSFK